MEFIRSVYLNENYSQLEDTAPERSWNGAEATEKRPGAQWSRALAAWSGLTSLSHTLWLSNAMSATLFDLHPFLMIWIKPG